MVMEAANFRHSHHPTDCRWLDCSGLGTIHLEGKMGTKSVVIGDIRGEHSPEMPVIEDDDMIEHIATDTPDESLAVGILPGTARGDLDIFDAMFSMRCWNSHTVNRVPIP
jgi:hypothetical protein